jgi:hypothetical protein
MQGADTAHGDHIRPEYRELLPVDPHIQKFIHLYFSETFRMRPLTEEETKILFEKLSKYIGDNVKLLIDRADGAYCFRYS